MKNVFTPIVGLILLIPLFFSCSKIEEQPEQQIEINPVLTKMSYGSSDGRNPTTDILSFSTIQDYENMVTQLEQAIEDWDDAFVTQWGFLDEDELDTKEEELNFDDQKPLTDFEILNDFYSLRNQFYEEEDAWLNNEVLDENNDPNDKEIYNFDDVEMALMNPKGEVKIGQTIYKFVDSGILKILDGDFNKLIQYNNGDSTVVNLPNVIFEEKASGACSAWKEKSDYRYFNGNRRVKRKLRIRSVTATVAHFRAKIISYKRKNGRWKRKRMWMGVAVQTYTFCNNYSRPGWSGWKFKNRKQVAKRMTHWNNPGHLRARRNGTSVKGYYQYAGYNNIKLLAW